MLDVLVVGAGISGLAAAQALQRAGLAVRVLEKSRGVGGRMATRRISTPHGDVRVDHGAQYFTCRSEDFQEVLAPLLAQGQVMPWVESVPTLTQTGIEPADPQYTYPRYACPQGMTTLAKIMARNLTIAFDTRVTGVLPGESSWRVITAEEVALQARSVLLTPPAPQSCALLSSLTDTVPTLHSVNAIEFDPCLAVIAGYAPASGLERLPPGLRWEADPLIAWSAVDSSKRTAPPCPVLVFHSTPQFAQAQIGKPEADLVTQVLAQAQKRLAPYISLDLTQPEWSLARPWRYSQPVNPLTSRYVLIGTNEGLPAPLALCGCWCSEGRVEGAFRSGQTAAQALLSRLT
ncbi:NAD(P)/FAD-dependent oxidoreductase [Anthocerotibacter panamensis]|uniref:NAD(P)/FAD-dependent oxidoreductase n=1 Tax=Anthocerotibacter panamensis TaxID=2857077 RepID=UPI001C4022BC|nr:FAD-dependent oxidoreductase [Anthocerotibacter panamensis]